MKCINCGFENKEGNIFCEGCGTKLVVPQMPKFCMGCGKEIVAGHLFCTGCGKKVEPVETNISPANEERIQLSVADVLEKEKKTSDEKRKKKSPIVAIIIAVIVVALVVASALWVISTKDTNNKKDDTTQNNPTQIEEQEEIPSTDIDIEETETQVQEIETEVEEVLLGITDYQAICMNLMEIESAYGSVNEKMAVDMAQMMVSACIIPTDSAYCTNEMSTEAQESLIYRLGYPSCDWLLSEDGLRSNLINCREEAENAGLDLGYASIVYKKDDFMKVAEAFGAYAMPSGSVDIGDYVGFIPADGGPWYYFNAYDIKENDNYIMVKAASYEGNNAGGDNVYQGTIKVLFEKTSDSILGMRAVYVEGASDTITQNIASITASSYLPDYNEKTYRPENLIDGNYGTPWVESVEGVGAGETIQITLNSKMWVQELVLHNGYQSSEELFAMNGYVTKISVNFGDGLARELDCTNCYYSGTDREYACLNKLSLDKPVYTDTIVITILGANEGSKYSDTCISEIELH